MNALRGELACSEGRYLHAIAELRGRMDLSPQELYLLGTAELARREYHAAELHLLRPHLMGVPEASVRYGAVLLETGRADQARAHLESVMPALGELNQAEALHLLALAELSQGHFAQAARQAEAAAQQFLRQGQELRGGAPFITSAWAGALAGDLDRSEAALHIALTVSPERPDPSQRVRAWSALSWVLAVQGRDQEAHEPLAQASALASHCEALEVVSFQLFVQHEVDRWRGRTQAAQEGLNHLASDLPPTSHWWPWVWTMRAADAVREGRWDDAFLALGHGDPQASGVQMLRGALLSEVGEGAEAELLLRAAQQEFAQGGQALEAAQAGVYLARLLTGSAREEAVRRSLDHLLQTHLMRLGQLILAQLAELAAPSPRSRAAVAHLTPLPERPQVVLGALGSATATLAGQPVRLPVALLACLLLEGEQRRSQLEIKLYPERSAAAASSAVKQDIFQARRVLGKDAVRSVGTEKAITYRLGNEYTWRLDVQDVLQGCSQMDAVRVFKALSGELLPHCPSEWTLGIQQRLDDAVFQMTRRLISVYAREGLATHAGLLLEQFEERYPEHPELSALRQMIPHRESALSPHRLRLSSSASTKPSSSSSQG
jgi:tetratricopeptide (TPR) repeat protein